MTDATVMIGEEEITLESILAQDMTEVEEYRFTVTPAGKYLFRIKDAKLEAREAINKDDPQGPKVLKPTINFELEVQNCFAVLDPKLKPENEVGRIHNETTWINDAIKDLGRVKAFLLDIGLDANKPLADLLAESHGMEFITDITNTPDKNNPDRIYANLKNTMSVDKFAEKHPEYFEAAPVGVAAS